MNYQKHYDLLIERAKNRSILKTEYKESHHIIPKSIGGSNHKSNLVDLFPEEHIIAHLLLMRIHNYHPKLVYAVSAMTEGFNKSKDNVINNKKYGFLRRKISNIKSEYLTENHFIKKMNDEEREEFLNNNVRGENNPMFGKKHTLDTKNKTSKINKGFFIAIDKDGNKFRIKNTDERYISGELIAQSKGRRVSEKTKLLISKQNSNENNPNAKEYIVYDENDNVVYSGKGGFVSFLNKNGIPKGAVYRSIKENTRLYYTKKQLPYIYKKGAEKFIGWKFVRLN